MVPCGRDSPTTPLFWRGHLLRSQSNLASVFLARAIFVMAGGTLSALDRLVDEALCLLRQDAVGSARVRHSHLRVGISGIGFETISEMSKTEIAKIESPRRTQGTMKGDGQQKIQLLLKGPNARINKVWKDWLYPASYKIPDTSDPWHTLYARPFLLPRFPRHGPERTVAPPTLELSNSNFSI